MLSRYLIKNAQSMHTAELCQLQVISSLSTADTPNFLSAFGRILLLSRHIPAIPHRIHEILLLHSSKTAFFLSPNGLFQAQNAPKRCQLVLCSEPHWVLWVL